MIEEKVAGDEIRDKTMSETDSDNFEDVTVTTIIPFSEEYTPREMLDEAIESVENQKDVDAVPLVIEDEDQRGPAWARNVGLDQAETRYVAFLDADDLWEETKLKRQLRRMDETGAGMCVEGGTNLSSTYFEWKSRLPDLLVGGPKSDMNRSTMEFIEGLLTSEIFGLTSSIVIDTEQVDVRFDESLNRREDHLFLIETAAQAGVCFVHNISIARKYEGGLSSRVEKSVDQVHTFFEKVTERVPEAQRFRQEYYQDAYVYLGRTKHYESEYLAAIPYFLRSLDYGPNMKAIGALGLTMMAMLYHYPQLAARKILNN